MAANLESIEAILTDRAEELGATIRRGLGVSGVEVTDDDVTVHAGGETFRGGWLVGCDAARSYFVQLELVDAAMLEPGHHDPSNGAYIFDLPNMISMVEFDGGASHRVQPITRAHVQAVLRRISGAQIGVTVLWLTTIWTDRAYLATEYRKGRVLLAGDAAHIHSPLGGQGLNLGLGDSMNLGWKLTATIRGNAAPGLLESYQRERRPVAEQILDLPRAKVALMPPSRSSRALRAIVRDLIATRDGATYAPFHRFIRITFLNAF